jgi:circadian clock protein KaiC
MTLALQFLLEGSRHSESGLYVTLSESERELRLVAKRHGWTLKDIAVFELVPPEATLDPKRNPVHSAPSPRTPHLRNPIQDARQ